VGGEESDAPQAVDLVDDAEKVSQVGLAGKVVAVGIDVLTKEGDLSRAPLNQTTHFSGDHPHWLAVLTATSQVDDTVRTVVVTALHHRHIAAHRHRLGNGHVRRRAGSPPLESELEETFHIRWAQEEIDEGESSFEGCGVLAY
jgi:hypothetical protein